MKSIVLVLLLNLPQVFAAEPPKNEAAKTPAATSTEHSFDDLLVQGKYHFADEAVTTVEEDKVLDALIGVRTDFKDRMQQSTGLY